MPKDKTLEEAQKEWAEKMRKMFEAQMKADPDFLGKLDPNDPQYPQQIQALKDLGVVKEGENPTA